MERKTEPEPPEMIHIELPSGGIATVSATAAPETLAALDALMQAAAASRETSTTTPDEEAEVLL
jgi:hypothetical protein